MKHTFKKTLTKETAMKRFILVLIIILCVGLLGCGDANKEGKKVSDNISEEVTEEKLEELTSPEEITPDATPEDWTEEDLEDRLEQNYYDYNTGKITYYEARDTIVSIKGTGLLSQETISIAEDELEELQASKTIYDLAVDCMQKQKFLEAMDCYEEVLEKDTLYPLALAGFEKAERAYIDESMQKAEAEYNQKNYPAAIQILVTCHGNLESDHPEIESQAIKYEFDYVQDSLQRAREAFETKGDYYEALSILRVTQAYLSYQDQDLQDAMDLYISYQPVELKDLTMFMGDGIIEYTDSRISDNFGNSYSGYYDTSILREESTESYFYALNGRFDILSGIVFINQYDMNYYCGNIEIYGDGKKLFESKDLEPATLAQQFSVSVTGIAQLEFRIHSGIGGWNGVARPRLANVVFEKSVPTR